MLFIFLFYKDNKYQAPPPYGEDGSISITQEDLEQNRPLFLIDGWIFTDSNMKKSLTYIGEFPSLQRGNNTIFPHGKATYSLILSYNGNPLDVCIRFPQIYSDYIITLGDKQLASGSGSASVFFTLTSGDHLLTVKSKSTLGYYSGIYHPPILGISQVVQHNLLIQSTAYGIACFTSLVLALFTVFLWWHKGNELSLWFGLLCCCYSGYLLYYFIRLFLPSFSIGWFWVQSCAMYGLCLCTLRLAALCCNSMKNPIIHRLWRCVASIACGLLTMALLIPLHSSIVWLHGIFTDIFYLLTFFTLLWIILSGGISHVWEQAFTQSACICFGIGLLFNLLFSNLFEPILLFWQFEWCGLLLVFFFAVMMALRNRRILVENLSLTNHLETVVEQRTQSLTKLLQERKVFFADMAHDLKAPIFATKTFIKAIRDNDTVVDKELLYYIDLVEQKQQELDLRVQGLNELNRRDALSAHMEPISVQDLLQELLDSHSMTATVQSINLIIEPDSNNGYIYAEHGKLIILFENLIYNALQATPPDGIITIATEFSENICNFTVNDTGCGIKDTDLPHIFKRFYVGQSDKEAGSGLGLYIAKTIVEELNGEISVFSREGHGTTFFVDLPLMQ